MLFIIGTLATQPARPRQSIVFIGEATTELYCATGIGKNGLNRFNWLLFSTWFGTDIANALSQSKTFPFRSLIAQYLPGGDSGDRRIINHLQVAEGMLYRQADEVARNGALQRINFGQRFS
jgi:hypothetical protein